MVQVVVSSAAGLDSFTASPSLVKMASSFMQSSTSGLGKHSSYFTHFLSKFTNIDWVFCLSLFSTERHSTVKGTLRNVFTMEEYKCRTYQ